MYSDTITAYLIKSLKGELPAAEKALLEEWMAISEENRDAAEEFLDRERLKAGVKQLYNSKTIIWNRLKEQAEITPPAHIIRAKWWRWAAAAMLAAVMATGVYFWLKPSPQNTVIAGIDIPPGGNKAMLALEDGSVIVLDSAADGLINAGNGIMKRNAVLSYTATSKENKTADAYNTLTTPRGGQYQLVLPDGTRVWLNAASSLKYPVSFSASERKVELKGEAYFEIAGNAAAPFKVLANKTEILVLGTQFNVMAYSEELNMITTLLQGSVKVMNDRAQNMLKPGEQSVINSQGEMITKTADIRQALAWKNGLFSFKDADIRGIMRQISRWYDVEVEYKGDVPRRSFSGYVFRNLSLVEVLKVLELSDIKCKIEGKKIIITP